VSTQGFVTGVMIFHPPASAGAFDAWLAELRACAHAAPGFRGCATSVRGAHLDRAVAVHFDGEQSLHAWLDGAALRGVLDDGRARGHWLSSGVLVLGDGVSTHPGISAFRHGVASGKEDEFLAIQERLATASSAFAGYEGTVVLAPESGNEWLSVLRFRTAKQLGAWLDSAERDHALPGLRSSLSKGFSSVSSTTPFATTVRVQDGKTLMTPNWKSAMLVLLVLYPTVMVLSRFLGPIVDRAGAEPWLALWISQIFSVSALQWWLMPNVTRPFRGWLDPVDGAGWRTSARGAAVIVVGYAATLALFASVKWLQFWDYG
jgi:uncharacterized protein